MIKFRFHHQIELGDLLTWYLLLVGQGISTLEAQDKAYDMYKSIAGRKCSTVVAILIVPAFFQSISMQAA